MLKRDVTLCQLPSKKSVIKYWLKVIQCKKERLISIIYCKMKDTLCSWVYYVKDILLLYMYYLKS